MYLHKRQVTTPTTTAATAVVRDTGAAQKLVQCRISRKPKQINRPPGRNNCRLELSAFEALGLGFPDCLRSNHKPLHPKALDPHEGLCRAFYNKQIVGFMWGLTQPFKASKIMSLKAWKITCMVQVWQGCWIAKRCPLPLYYPHPATTATCTDSTSDNSNRSNNSYTTSIAAAAAEVAKLPKPLRIEQKHTTAI